MCKTCWEENGSPAVWNENVKTAVGLMKKIYEHDPMGNPLHVVLEDWNLEDQYIQVWEGARRSIPVEAVLAAESLVPLLLRMSLEERYSAIAYAHDYLILPESC